MSRSRDLSGFGTPPRKSEAPKPEPSNSAPARRSEGATKSMQSRRTPKQKAGVRRITLSLPTSVASDLKATAQREATYYLDVILNALVDHGEAVRAGHGAPRRIGNLEVPPPRRKRPAGRTQIPLNIPIEALNEIDRVAAETGLDRSGFVTELLEHAL